MTLFIDSLSQSLFHFLWQGTVVAALLSVVLFFLRRQPANLRYLVTCSAMLLMVLLPVLTTFIIYQQQISIPAPMYDSGTTAEPVTTSTEDVITGSISKTMAAFNPDKQDFASYQTWFLRLWVLGVVLFSIRLILAYNHVNRLCKCAIPVDRQLTVLAHRVAARIGLDQPFELMLSNIADGPGVVGWLKPVILLPPGIVMGLTTDQLEAVLAHELAHIRRYDYLINILQSIVEVLLFYHPAVWWVSDQVRKERELCCDDVAILISQDPVGLARALAEMEKQRMMYPQPAVGMAGHSLAFRVLRLLGHVQESRRAPGLAMVIAIMLCLSVAVGTLVTYDSQAQVENNPTTVSPAGADEVINFDIYTIDGDDRVQVAIDHIALDDFQPSTLKSRLIGKQIGEGRLLLGFSVLGDVTHDTIKPVVESLRKTLAELGFSTSRLEELENSIGKIVNQNHDRAALSRLMNSAELWEQALNDETEIENTRRTDKQATAPYMLAQAGKENEGIDHASQQSSELTDEQIKQTLIGEWFGETDTPTSKGAAVYRFKLNDAGELEAFRVNNPNNPHTLTTKVYRFILEDGNLILSPNIIAAEQEGRFVGFRGKFTGDAIVGESVNKYGSSPLTLKKGRYVIPVFPLSLSAMVKEQLRGRWLTETRAQTARHPETGDEVEIKQSMLFSFDDDRAGNYIGRVEVHAEMQYKDREKQQEMQRPLRNHATRFKINEASLDDGDLTFRLYSPKAVFEGRLEGNIINGEWVAGAVKGGIAGPLAFTRTGQPGPVTLKKE